MAQVFLYVVDGCRTLWVPTHKPTPEETGPTVMLSSATAAELSRAFHLFDFPVVISDSPSALTLGNRFARSSFDIVKAVNEFREKCQSSSDFMLKQKYDPAAQPPQLAPKQEVQLPMVPTPLWGTMMSPPPFQSLVQQLPGSSAFPFPQAPFGPFGAGAFFPNNFHALSHHHHQFHHHLHSHHLHHHHHHFSAPAAPRCITMPEPVVLLPDIPEEILELYRDTQTKVIITSLSNSRCTVWLRGHDIATGTAQGRYVHASRGVVMIVKPTMAEIAEGKPVFLFDKPICSYFVLKGECTRGNCVHTHHSEQQIRDLASSKHVELAQMTKDERKALADAIILKEFGEVYSTAGVANGGGTTNKHQVGVASDDEGSADGSSESSSSGDDESSENDADDDHDGPKAPSTKKKDGAEMVKKERTAVSKRPVIADALGATGEAALSSPPAAPSAPPPFPPPTAPFQINRRHVRVPLERLGVESDSGGDSGSEWSSSSSSSESSSSSSSDDNSDEGRRGPQAPDPVAVLHDLHKEMRRVFFLNVLETREQEEKLWRKNFRVIQNTFKEEAKTIRKKLKKEEERRAQEEKKTQDAKHELDQLRRKRHDSHDKRKRDKKDEDDPTHHRRARSSDEKKKDAGHSRKRSRDERQFRDSRDKQRRLEDDNKRGRKQSDPPPRRGDRGRSREERRGGSRDRRRSRERRHDDRSRRR
jgi:hypothetical protein